MSGVDGKQPSEEAEALARRFHETYERLAPSFGYKTREASAVPWEDVPEQNKRLMVAVCESLFPEPVVPVSNVVEALRRRAGIDRPPSDWQRALLSAADYVESRYPPYRRREKNV